MNTAEKAIVVLLFLLLLSWGFYQRVLNPAPAGQPPVGGQDPAALAGETNAAEIVDAVAVPALREPVAVAASAAEDVAAAPAVTVTAPDIEPESLDPEHTVQLANEEIAVTISSRGAAVVSATLSQYRGRVERDSDPVVLDFAERPALSLEGVRGISRRSNFDLELVQGATQLTARAVTPSGLALVRKFSLVSGYRLLVTDTFQAPLETGVDVPACGINLGPMQSVQSRTSSRGISYLGLDTLPDLAGRDVTHWGKKKIPEFFGRRSGLAGCARQDTSTMPPAIDQKIGMPVAWVAAKNKFFVQILVPDGAADCELHARRETNTTGTLKISSVAATVFLPARTLGPGESTSREVCYYVGPKKYEILRSLGGRQAEVMQFGWWAWFRWVCALLLGTLNAIHRVIPNYGVAIILLTIIVKIVFWPLTHKSTESAKKMQQIQPLVAELREKYKSQPQKMQQAQMALYKEHGVNPMASCLPMLVQLPIFIALFTVLRSAVELRFAPFLWIVDLSEPEGLFASVLPIPVNLLPLAMTATMVLQQRLTPTAGDPQQQKMMMFMPVVMLFVFYNMASALVLYWTVSQCLSIAQLLWQRRAKARTSGSS